MNVGPELRGDPAGITVRFIGPNADWALALSRDYFLRRLQERLSAEMPLPYQVYRKCTVRGPGGGCWNRTTVTLTTLSVGLETGHIRINGSLTVHDSRAVVPHPTPPFSA